MRELVRLADAMYVAAAEQAQERSRKEYQAEFGHDGPSLAGFLSGGADRNYHYARHKAGECPLPRHQKWRQRNPATVDNRSEAGWGVWLPTGGHGDAWYGCEGEYEANWLADRLNEGLDDG